MLYGVCSVTHCDSMDCSAPGASVPGVPQVRIQEWLAKSSSGGSPQSRGRTCISCIGRRILYH